MMKLSEKLIAINASARPLFLRLIVWASVGSSDVWPTSKRYGE